MSDEYIHIRIRRSTGVAAVVSLLLHVLMLFVVSRQDLLNQHRSAIEQPLPISVRLNPRTAPKQQVESAPVASVTPPREVRHPKIQPPPAPHPPMPKVIATTRPELPSMPPPKDKRPAAPLDPSKFPDMASYLRAVRENRGDAGNGEVASHSRTASEEDARMANIQRNLQQPGTNGVFDISRMDAHTATFSFKGWKSEYSYSRREVYQVDAGLNGDIERAVVRKMIEIIRQYYNGDFNWESYRLGRMVVLSARPQDNDGLEDFLLQEFFGS